MEKIILRCITSVFMKVHSHIFSIRLLFLVCSSDLCSSVVVRTVLGQR